MTVWASLAIAAILASAPDYRVLFFTAPWCGPCRPVHELLRRTIPKASRDRIELTTIDFDGARAEAEERWGVHEIPVVIVLAPDGRIVLRADGAERDVLKNLEAALRNLVQPAKKKERK